MLNIGNNKCMKYPWNASFDIFPFIKKIGASLSKIIIVWTNNYGLPVNLFNSSMLSFSPLPTHEFEQI